jgi:hypothetical protein
VENIEARLIDTYQFVATTWEVPKSDTHDGWCSLNAEEPYVTWMEEHEQRGGYDAEPEAAPWLAEYLHEMTVFPKGKHDDQVDSTAQFLDWFKMPIASWGIYEATRRRAEALEQSRKPQPTQTVWAIGCMEWLAEQNKSS